MLILAIETTSDLCSIAIRDDAGTFVERAFRHRMHLSERLMGDVEELLRDAGIALADVDGFGVGIGPGSFTGVRLGVMTVKTWADVLGKPVAGVSALEALAHEYRGLSGFRIVPVIRARPGALYAQVFRGTPATPEPESDPEMLSVGDLTSRLEADATPCLVCGDGLIKARVEIEACAREAGVTVTFGRTDGPRASTVAEIATARILIGKTDSAIDLVPLYIAPPPIGVAARSPRGA